MTNAVASLLSDHKMIRHLLASFYVDHPRFPEILKTLERVVRGHAWMEDAVFLPALDAEPLLQRRFLDEVAREHKDLDFLLRILRRTPAQRAAETEALVVQVRAVLTTHLVKEEEGLFPLAEKILGVEGLSALNADMERRKSEIRPNEAIDG
jgi:hemerythrin-like domain-containing protein